jgi:hypothetical protein
MSTLQEIKDAIGKLSPQELEELHAWMEEQYPHLIDAQLKADLDAGLIDGSMRQVLAGLRR